MLPDARIDEIKRQQEWLHEPNTWASTDTTTRAMATIVDDLLAERRELVAALREIANPVAFHQDCADKTGRILDTGMALYMSNSATYLRGVALMALGDSALAAAGEHDAT